MNEMIDRVRAAIDEALSRDVEVNDGEMTAMARAAIEAMREPTPEMVHACPAYRDFDSKVRDWQFMIDAALGVSPS